MTLKLWIFALVILCIISPVVALYVAGDLVCEKEVPAGGSGYCYYRVIPSGETVITTTVLGMKVPDEPITCSHIKFDYVTNSPDLDTWAYTARPYFTVDRPVINASPDVQEIIYAIATFPFDIGDGGRYAVIRICEGVINGSQICFDSKVFLTIQGSTFIQTGTLTGISYDAPTSLASTSFRNTGNIHYYTEDVVTAKKYSASEVCTSRVLPTAEVVYRVPLSLPPGTYRLTSSVKTQDKIKLDSGTISVIVP